MRTQIAAPQTCVTLHYKNTSFNALCTQVNAHNVKRMFKFDAQCEVHLVHSSFVLFENENDQSFTVTPGLEYIVEVVSPALLAPPQLETVQQNWYTLGTNFNPQLKNKSVQVMKTGKLLGSGIYPVYEGVVRYDNVNVSCAIKELKTSNIDIVNDELSRITKMFNTMHKKSHANPATMIVIHGIIESPVQWIVMEKMDITLEQLLYSKEESSLLMKVDKVHLALQCLLAVRELHSVDIVHRDIKPGNILLNLSDIYALKLCDFGSTKRNTTISTDSAKQGGTEMYISPERLETNDTKNFTFEQWIQCDVYSIGVVMAEVLIGKRPFSMFNNLNMGLGAQRLQSTKTWPYDLRCIQHTLLRFSLSAFLAYDMKKRTELYPLYSNLLLNPQDSNMISENMLTLTTDTEEVELLIPLCKKNDSFFQSMHFSATYIWGIPGQTVEV